MLYKQTKTKTHKNQSGFASIVIALILIIVLSLITLAFAQMSRREQRNALSRQLATQAYYAAETGINDTWKILPSIPSENDPKKCLNPSVVTPNLNPSIDPTTGVSYSCILVDKTPGTLVKKPVIPNSSWYTTFATDGDLNSLNIKWNSTTPGKTSKGSSPGKFTPSAGWGNHPAVLEVSLTPLSGSTPPSRDDLMNNTFTVFLYPSSNSGAINFDTQPSAQGQIISGGCMAAGCSATIGGISGSVSDHYLVRIINYYDTSELYIADAKDSAGNPLNFVDAQATIDATGKARNVLKRLQVAVPINQPYNLPDYALEAQNLCKRLDTRPGSTTPVSPCT